MKQFQVYKYPTGELQAVKIGFSWPAFFFSSFWAMACKMWLIGLGSLVVFLILGFLSGPTHNGTRDLIFNLLSLGASFLFGIYGNDWRRDSLRKRGFEEVDVVSAASKEGAIAVYLKEAGQVQAAARA